MSPKRKKRKKPAVTFKPPKAPSKTNLYAITGDSGNGVGKGGSTINGSGGSSSSGVTGAAGVTSGSVSSGGKKVATAPPSSSLSMTSGSSSTPAAPQEAAQKAVEALGYVSDLLGGKGKKKSVSQNYAKQTEKARSKREAQSKKVQKTTKKITTKYKEERTSLPEITLSGITAGKDRYSFQKKPYAKKERLFDKNVKKAVGQFDSAIGSKSKGLKVLTNSNRKVDALSTKDAVAYVPASNANKIVLTPDVATAIAAGIKGIPPAIRDEVPNVGRNILFHELAHTQQRPGAKRVEPSADLIAADVAKSVGDAYDPGYPEKIKRLNKNFNPYSMLGGKGTKGSFENTEDSRPRIGALDGVKKSAAKGTAAVEKAISLTSGPKPRKVAKKLTKAVAKSGGGVPEIVPPQYRAAVARHGKMLEPALKEAGVDMTGPEYLARLIQFESGWSPTAENPSSAYGLGQFIDSTAEDFRTRLGVETQDPSKPGQMIKGAAMHASGKFGYNPLYAGYNPGYSDSDPILSVDAGQTVGNSKPVPKALKRTARQTLGKKPTKAILQGGKVVKDPQAGEKVSGAVPYREMKKYIVPTEAKSEIAAEQRAPAKTMLTGMSPELQSALVQLAKNTGIPVRINEGYRTAERANDFPSGTASQHHQGNAADIDNNADYTAEDLAKVGLNNTAVGGEPWHFQPNDPSGNGGTVNTNIPIQGTNLAIQLPTPTTTTSGGVTSTGTTSGVPGTSTSSSTYGPAGYQAPNGKSRSGYNVSRVLNKIEARLTTPLTELPEISQELIDAILRKYR